MSYTAPPTFAHGDYPTASDLNILSDDLDAIHDITGDAAINFATLASVSSAVFTFVHAHRYLYFGSNGAIVDPSGVGDDVSISEENGATTKYDLDQISWLFYGQIYQVTGVSWCIESEM